MVRKLKMHFWHFGFRHMARHAFLGRYGTRRSAPRWRLRLFRIGEMAGKTFCVVIGGFTRGLFVRIVTCDAAQPWIGRVMFLTAEKPVGLESHRVGPLWHIQNFFKADMTCAAKLL